MKLETAGRCVYIGESYSKILHGTIQETAVFRVNDKYF